MCLLTPCFMHCTCLMLILSSTSATIIRIYTFLMKFWFWVLYNLLHICFSFNLSLWRLVARPKLCIYFFSTCIAHRSHIKTSSFSPSDLSSVSFTWCSHLHFILHAMVPKFLSSVSLLPAGCVSVLRNHVQWMIQVTCIFTVNIQK